MRSPIARSRAAARSGTDPRKKNTADTVKYVVTANTSHTSGDLKFGHRKREFGYGISQYACQTRPTWMSGKRPAVMTANTVIASAVR